MRCACCGRAVQTPTAEVVIVSRSIPAYQATILEVVWSGKGLPVASDRIIRALYEDRRMPNKSDPRDALKIGIHRLRKALLGSGISVESAGWGRGYFININPQETQP